ncbi:LytR/AlgR family response regulator transcription factor [Colwellia piezophila]|uniref:LytR/AlgR family response regulator transcription factor n=1 Tax=Colwellia piezophila TaxID=211668 RepID=UPI0003816B97|nr:response regulator transcription factor [Colwellia piezophila]
MTISNKRLKTIIVDDEPLALQLLRSKLNKQKNIEIIAECKNGREAIKAIHDYSPDLVFLDIQMPGIDGFGVIEKLQADILPLIIFATAYEQYALEAFDVHAVDYILKPIDEEHIQRAVSRAVSRFENKSAAQNIMEQKSKIIGAIATINNHGSQTVTGDTHSSPYSIGDLEHKIVIKDRDGMTLLKQSEIEWIDAAGDYTCLHVKGVTHIKRCPLKTLLNELDPTIFKRVHRSTIVNLNYIKKVIPHTKGEYFLQLGEFDQIKVSRNYCKTIKSYLMNN